MCFFMRLCSYALTLFFVNDCCAFMRLGLYAFMRFGFYALMRLCVYALMRVCGSTCLPLCSRAFMWFMLCMVLCVYDSYGSS